MLFYSEHAHNEEITDLDCREDIGYACYILIMCKWVKWCAVVFAYTDNIQHPHPDKITSQLNVWTGPWLPEENTTH